MTNTSSTEKYHLRFTHTRVRKRDFDGGSGGGEKRKRAKFFSSQGAGGGLKNDFLFRESQKHKIVVCTPRVCYYSPQGRMINIRETCIPSAAYIDCTRKVRARTKK